MPPVNIVGDIHGQYADLKKIFELEGEPPKKNYLFLGDYIGRGPMQLEVILLMLAYKIKYPENFFMLRGCHETKAMAMAYGFNKALNVWDGKEKIVSQISKENRLFRKFIDVFN